MKVLFIILFLSSAAFAQENPWENKGKENPWGNQTKEVEKKDSVQTTALKPNKDSVSVTVVQFDMNQPVKNEQQLIEAAQEQVSSEYSSSGDFAVGFTTGFLLNVFALTPDVVYVLVDNKQEKALQSKIDSDSTYSSVDDEKLRSKTRKTVKSKKFFATIGGAAVGSLVQIFFFIAIIAAN